MDCLETLSFDLTLRAKSIGFDFYQGRVRDCLSRDDLLIMVHTDRLSAYHKPLSPSPQKGAILNQINLFWLARAKAIGVNLPSYYSPDPRILITERLEPLPFEVIVRGYLAGSIARAYARGQRSYAGIDLKDGLAPYSKLGDLAITPRSKTSLEKEGAPLCPQNLIAAGVLSSSEWTEISEISSALYEEGKRIYGEKGLILVDSKYEFARNRNGKITLIDEINTPDSCRLWRQTTYFERLAAGAPPDHFDKELVRRFLLTEGYTGEGPVPEIPAALLALVGRTYREVLYALSSPETNLECSTDQTNECLSNILEDYSNASELSFPDLQGEAIHSPFERKDPYEHRWGQ